jgi:thiamine-phosphate pyrophosphorylase
VNDDLEAVHDARGGLLADGVHLGRQDAAEQSGLVGPRGIVAGLRAARARLGPELLLGTSTRTRTELAAALQAGADHVGFGAMAPSPTKTDARPADLEELRACVAAYPDVPLYPIGGLGAATLGPVRTTGCRRAAVGSAILDAPDPAAATEALLAILDA